MKTKIFIARQHSNADARYWYSNSLRRSVRLSVTFRYNSMETLSSIIILSSAWPNHASYFHYWIIRESPTVSHSYVACLLSPVWSTVSSDKTYFGCTLQMKTLFPGWPIMVHDTHTRRRRNLDETYVYTFITGNSTWPLLCVGCHVGLYSSFISCPTIVVVSIRD